MQLTGLNTVLNSAQGDRRGDLVLGSFQSQLPRSVPAIRIAIAHHPPSWIKDWNNVEPFIRRAHVIFFGHEHAFEPHQFADGGSVQISAGAVTPEREPDGLTDPWIPSYNIVTLSCADKLRVEVNPRRWDVPTSRFAEDPAGRQEFDVDLDPAVDDLVAARTPIAEPVDASPLVPVNRSHEDPDEADAARAVGLRLLAVKFMNLATSEKVAIARQLGAFEESEEQRPLDDVFPEVLERIRDRAQIEQLRELVVHYGNL